MSEGTGRVAFRIGDAFPADDPVAIFLVSVSTALSDLLMTSKWLIGADHDGPFEREVGEVEHSYLLRLGWTQLHEIRASIVNARGNEDVEAFIDDLPPSATGALERLMTVNTDSEQWIRRTMEYVRHQTVHYGGKWNWDDVSWALRQARDLDGEIENRNSRLSGLELSFAAQVATQHLTRMIPEFEDNPDVDIEEDVLTERLTTLFQAMSEVMAAAHDFAVTALMHYVDRLPEGTLRTIPASS